MLKLRTMSCDCSCGGQEVLGSIPATSGLLKRELSILTLVRCLRIPKESGGKAYYMQI